MEPVDHESELLPVGDRDRRGTEPYRPLGLRAKWAIGLLVAGMVADAVAIGSGAMERSLLADIAAGEVITDAKADANDTRQLAIGVVQGGLFVLTAAAFLFWFSRAYRNLTALGSRELRFGRGWAVGAWFVPILNLWRPKQIGNEIWRKSAPDPADDPESVPKLHLAWWLAWLVMGWLYSLATRRAVRAEEIDALREVNSLYLAADVVALLAGTLALLVVRRTTARETARAQQLALEAVEDPTPAWRRGSAWAALVAVLVALALQGLLVTAVWSGSLDAGGAGGEPVARAPGSAPPDALFADDFSQTGVWLLQENRSYSFDYVSGAYRIVVKEQGLWSSVRGLPEQADALSVEVDVSLQAGRASTDFYGLSCSASSRGSYLFGISPDGYHTMAFDPGGDQVIDIKRLLEETARRPFRTGSATNRLRGACVRDGEQTVLTLAVNGTTVAETVHRGDLGAFVGVELFAYSENGGTDVRFDDLVVREPTAR